MSLNIGTLVGYLQLDDANFERKADAADRKISALQLHLQALAKENPKISVEVDAQTAQLDELKLKLAALKEQAASGADVRVDAVQALIELDRVQTKIRELHGKTVRVEVDVDKSKIDEATSALDGLGGSLGLLPALAIAGTSALIPLVGVVGGLALALGAPLALAAGGLTVFGFLAGLAAKDTEARLKAIEKLRQHLGTLTKGTTAYAQAQQQLKDAQAALTPEQRKFAAAQDGLTGAFQKFLAGPGGKTLLDVMAQGMTVLSHLLPVISPLIEAVGNALTPLLDSIDKSSQGKGLHNLVGELSRLMGPNITAGVHIIGNLAGGLGSLLLALARSHLSHEVVQGVVDLTGSFAKWAGSSAARHDVRDLFAYVHKVGPQVGSTLGAIARAAGHLVSALAPLGPPVLKVVEGIANAISKIPVPVLTALAAAFVAMTAASKVGKGLSALGGLSGLTLGGGGAGGKLLGGLGVQKVYVVNLPPGGVPGVPGVPGEPVGGPAGRVGRAGRYLGYAGYAGLAYTAATAAAAPLNDVYKATLGTRLGNASSWVTSLLTRTPMRNGLTANVLPQGAANAIADAIKSGFSSIAPGDGSHNPVLEGRFPQFNPAYTDNTDKNTHSVKALGTAYDALKAHAQGASQQIDQIGPHAAAAFGAASRDVDAFRSKLAAIQDKKIAVILQDQAAVQSLEALQRMRLNDKTMTVTTIYQQRERTVGPGGGIGHHALGGWIAGPGSGMSDSVPFMGSNGEFVVRAAQAAANAPLLQAINTGSGRVSLASASGARGGYRSASMPERYALTITNWDEGTGHIEAIASDSHAADHRYATAVGRSQ